MDVAIIAAIASGLIVTFCASMALKVWR